MVRTVVPMVKQLIIMILNCCKTGDNPADGTMSKKCEKGFPFDP
jgi:hypothetical protein